MGADSIDLSLEGKKREIFHALVTTFMAKRKPRGNQNFPYWVSLTLPNKSSPHSSPKTSHCPGRPTPRSKLPQAPPALELPDFFLAGPRQCLCPSLTSVDSRQRGSQRGNPVPLLCWPGAVKKSTPAIPSLTTDGKIHKRLIEVPIKTLGKGFFSGTHNHSHFVAMQVFSSDTNDQS